MQFAWGGPRSTFYANNSSSFVAMLPLTYLSMGCGMALCWRFGFAAASGVAGSLQFFRMPLLFALRLLLHFWAPRGLWVITQ